MAAREEFNYLFSNPQSIAPFGLSSIGRLFSFEHWMASGLISASITPAVYLRSSAAVSGLNTINALTLPFLFKNTYHLSPAGLSLLTVAVSAPLFLRPFYATLADNNPIFGYRRKPYLMMAAWLEICAKLGVGFAVHSGCSLWVVTSCLVLGASGMVLDMTVRDTLLIETARPEISNSSGPASNSEPLLPQSEVGATLIADVSALGAFSSLSVSYFSGYLLGLVAPGTLIMASAGIPMISLSLAARLQEDVTMVRRPPMKLENLARTFQQSGGVLQGQAVSALVGATVPNFQDAMFFFYTDQLGLQPEFFGKFKLFGGIASLLSNALYRTFLRDVNQSQLCIVASGLTIPVVAMAAVVTSGNTVTLFGLQPATFILVRHCLYDALSTIAAIPNTVMLSKVAPRGNEGPFFAVYGSVNDLASILNGALSAATIRAFGVTAHNFDNITPLIIFTTFSSVLTAPWTLWTPESEGRHIIDEEPEVDVEMVVS